MNANDVEEAVNLLLCSELDMMKFSSSIVGLWELFIEFHRMEQISRIYCFKGVKWVM